MRTRRNWYCCRLIEEVWTKKKKRWWWWWNDERCQRWTFLSKIHKLCGGIRKGLDFWMNFSRMTLLLFALALASAIDACVWADVGWRNKNNEKTKISRSFFARKSFHRLEMFYLENRLFYALFQIVFIGALFVALFSCCCYLFILFYFCTTHIHSAWGVRSKVIAQHK